MPGEPRNIIGTSFRRSSATQGANITAPVISSASVDGQALCKGLPQEGGAILPLLPFRSLSGVRGYDVAGPPP